MQSNDGTDPNLFTDSLNTELESLSLNKLNNLGNQAIQLGLIIGHGHRGGQYEILRRGEVVLLSPKEAEAYLETLIQGTQDNPS